MNTIWNGMTHFSTDTLWVGACSGNIRDEPGAVVCRVSASFIRFGTFQLPASREEFHNIPRLGRLCHPAPLPSVPGCGLVAHDGCQPVVQGWSKSAPGKEGASHVCP